MIRAARAVGRHGPASPTKLKLNRRTMVDGLNRATIGLMKKNNVELKMISPTARSTLRIKHNDAIPSAVGHREQVEQRVLYQLPSRSSLYLVKLSWKTMKMMMNRTKVSKKKTGPLPVASEAAVKKDPVTADKTWEPRSLPAGLAWVIPHIGQVDVEAAMPALWVVYIK